MGKNLYQLPLRWQFPDGELFEDVEPQFNFGRVIERLQNFDVNLKTIGFKHSVSDLPKIKGSALIIDKAMASTKYYEQIDWLSRYKGTIIACDRALYSILPYDVVNQAKNVYVCNLDMSPLCISFFDRPDVKEVMDQMTAVFSVTTNPLTIRHWHGKRTFFTSWTFSTGLTKAIMELSQTPFMETGGQVACFAWVLALSLGANPIGIFGVSHGYDSKEESECPGAPHKRIKGPYGVVWQDPMYQLYNGYFLEFIERGKKEENVETVNTMKAGLLYSKDVTDMSLKEFVKSYE